MRKNLIMKSFKSKSDNEDPKESYDEFLACIKLVSGEEILSKVVVDYSSTEEKVILDNPVVCHEVRTHGANVPMGYKFEPWMKMSDEDVFVLSLDKVITISEIKDSVVIETYDHVVESGFKRQHPELNREMGYISTVDKARMMLKKLYDGKDASKDPKES
tara:strand:+ start:1286 stop:1765 length:480 start_codon:yes stop_codon:yes gene_type:complete